MPCGSATRSCRTGSSPSCWSRCRIVPAMQPRSGPRPSPSPAASPTPAASPQPTPTSSRPWSNASPPPRQHPARPPDPPGQRSATHPDRRISRAHPFPPASQPSASSGGQAPARPRFARAPGSARPLVHPPDDNPKIANHGLTPHLTGPALSMILAGESSYHCLRFVGPRKQVAVAILHKRIRARTREPDATPCREMRNEPGDRRARSIAARTREPERTSEIARTKSLSRLQTITWPARGLCPARPAAAVPEPRWPQTRRPPRC